MPHSPCRIHSQPSTTQRLCQRAMLGVCTLLVTIATFLIFANATTVHARQAPNRRDRRPDREVRIRYPRTQPQANGQGNGAILQSAPPTPQSNSPSDSQDSPSPGN